jgi:putative ABC transport system ATP-binding protein
MTAATVADGSHIGRGNELGALATIRRGLALSPELRRGLPVTLVLAALSTAGRVVVPIAVQQVIDHGLRAPGGPDLGFVRSAVLWSVLALAATALAGYLMNVRLFTVTESGLATLRTKAFRHVHDLSVLTQSTERRGALVSRVTSDVDTISTFMQWAGLMLVISVGQLLVSTVIMIFYSWELTLLVWPASSRCSSCSGTSSAWCPPRTPGSGSG